MSRASSVYWSSSDSMSLFWMNPMCPVHSPQGRVGYVRHGCAAPVAEGSAIGKMKTGLIYSREDHIRPAGSNQVTNGDDVAAGQRGHHRGVDDTQALDAVDPQLRIDHGIGVAAHFAGAGGVPECRSLCADERLPGRRCPGQARRC